MSIKRTLTTVAVDSFRDYLQEKLKELKQLDLDHDGRRDVDQVAEVLTHLSEKIKASIESTDFQKLASGLDQVMTGAGMIAASVDRQKLTDAGAELGTGLRQLGKLVRLGITEVKDQGHRS